MLLTVSQIPSFDFSVPFLARQNLLSASTAFCVWLSLTDVIPEIQVASKQASGLETSKERLFQTIHEACLTTQKQC
jgi:hypothetical protein